MTVVTGVIPSSPNTARSCAVESQKAAQTIVTLLDMSEVSSNLMILNNKATRMTSDEATQPTLASDIEDYELQSQSFRTSMSLNHKDGSGSSSSSSSATSSIHTPEDVMIPEEPAQVVVQIQQDHKTLRPHGPTAPCIKPYELPHIPVNTKRNAWLNLKAPSCVLARLSRSSSNNNSTPPQGAHNAAAEAPRRSIQFYAVEIREYEQTVGDNPSVSYGPPVSLDWNYAARQAVELDAYEANRGRRRTLRQMMLNYYHRTHLLAACLGYSESELQAAQKAAEKIKGQRSMTKATLAVSKLEEAWQSTKRKLGKGKKKGGD